MNNPNPQQSIRLFKSNFLERFTHVHPIVPLLLWVPVVAALVWRSWAVHDFSVWAILSLGPVGLISWTLTEYFMHRFVFHFQTQNKFLERLVYLAHGVHHDSPNDPTRLVMPPVVSIVLAVVLFSLFRGVFGLMGDANWVEPFFAFFLVGYLAYDYTHYAVHHFNTRSAVAKYLKQHHMNHHYVTPELRFGVSSPLWDLMFGTLVVRQKRTITSA